MILGLLPAAVMRVGLEISVGMCNLARWRIFLCGSYYFPVESLRAAKILKVANGKKNRGFRGYARINTMWVNLYIHAYPQCKRFIFATARKRTRNHWVPRKTADFADTRG